jgi:ABC-type nitrate/sulfonate/bicarbonate transport system substrate-binding protein
VVATDTAIKQKRGNIIRFLRGWNRALKFYQENPEAMIPYIQKKLAVSDAKMARRMYDEDREIISLTGILNNDAAREILDTAREALRIKEPVALEKVFDFSLGAEALR